MDVALGVVGGAIVLGFVYLISVRSSQGGQALVVQRPNLPMPLEVNQPSPVIIGLGKLVGNLGVNQGVIYRDSFGHQIMVERVATNTQSESSKVFIGRTAQGQTFAYRQCEDGSIEMVK